MVDDDELEKLRQKRIQQMEMEARYQEEEALRQREVEEHIASQRQAIMRQLLTPEARERLGRLRTAHPELAFTVEDQLIALAQSGRLARQLTDGDLRDILRRLAPKKREISITFKK